MKKFLLPVFAVLAMTLAFSSCGKKKEAQVPEETGPKNLIEFGHFTGGIEPWMLYKNGGKAELRHIKEGELEVAIESTGRIQYGIQPYYDGFTLYQGGEYKFSFDVRSTIPRELEWRIQLNGGDYHAYVGDFIKVTDQVSHIEKTFTMNEDTDFNPRLCINMGSWEECPDGAGEHSVILDNFELYLVDDSRVPKTSLSKKVPVNINQVGYVPEGRKLAVVRSAELKKIKGKFTVVDASTNEIVYKGKLRNSAHNISCEETTAIADFSDFKKPGTYRVCVKDIGESFPFAIGEDVYKKPLDSIVRMFYLQRCGTKVLDSDFGHEPCHSSKAVVFGTASPKIDVTGGWHDAGDYGRYVVPGAKAACDLMLAYEFRPELFSDATGIPESSNGVADVLDEVRYELEWMLKMQDKATGGVYHKVTCRDFPEVVAAVDETDQLFLSPVSLSATGDFAAAMAMAARIYSFDSDFSRICLDAAKKAAEYMDANPNQKGFRNPPSIKTGQYEDNDHRDELLWGYSELYKTTGDESYLSKAKAVNLNDMSLALGWQQVSLYGLYAYATSNAPRDDHYQTIRSMILGEADKKIGYTKIDSYGVSLTVNEYVWGSNMNVADNGMLFVLADKISGTENYSDAAMSQLDYLLGINTNSYCFVTGFGSLSPVAPHHRPSQVVKKPMAGMLVGGPNAKLNDPYAKVVLKGKPFAECYVDNDQSYSCNEITIYWNSPLVFLMACKM